jgi:hypothetical protein
MGTGTSTTDTQTSVTNKPARCSICKQIPRPDCDWQQGRCPHLPSLLDQILADFYLSRFYNLIKFFTGRK